MLCKLTDMRPVVLVFLLLFCLTNFITTFGYERLQVACHEGERHALLSFKQDIEDPANRLSSWDTGEDCCEWAGAVCNNVTGHVKELRLANNFYSYGAFPTLIEHRRGEEAFESSKLRGRINPSLLNLKHLHHLDLSYNDFGGIQIPAFLGSFGSLRYLNLSEAGFEGVIPQQLGNLSHLRSLGLRGPSPYPSFKISVDSLSWLDGLSSLRHLDLSKVDLSEASDWLQVINKLPSLLELRLSYCALDHIPPLPHVNFTSLSVLDLSVNQFDSPIPEWILNLNSLFSLDLSYNSFKEPIPGNIWNLTSLRILDISYNDLNTSLPNSLFTLNGLVSLSLSKSGIKGPIPCGFANVTSLKYLDLSENNFEPTIPNCLYSFHSLETLDLSFNDLEGELSSDLGNLSSLVQLSLSFNKLKGQIPRSIGNLCKVEAIVLESNSYDIEISEALESLSGCLSQSLKLLDLSGNHFYGPMRDQFLENLENLRQLSLNGNFITGPIPVSMGRLPSLAILNLAYNRLSGTLPESFGGLSNLQELYLDGNYLEGAVSEVHFANLTKLSYLTASGNSLTFRAIPTWNPPFQLVTLDLRSWHLGPQFPKWLKSQKSMSSIDLSNSNLSDTVPSWFWDLSSHANYLNLSHNQLSGQMPKMLSFLEYDGVLVYLSSNNFTGPLPLLSPNVIELDLSSNSFSGGLFDFLCDMVGGPKFLEVLHLGRNRLSGKVPDCWKNWPVLQVINLVNNDLTGTFPVSEGDLTFLRSLHLRNNSFSGEPPTSLQRCKDLVTLDIGMNNFSGGIPSWIGSSLLNLKVLSLRSNKLTGGISHELCKLASLQIMDAADNELSGSVPKCFSNLKAMARKQNSSQWIDYSYYYGQFLENADIVIKGNEFQFDSILTLVTSLDLSSNKLSGVIPEELTTLLGLLSLNLSNNQLTGKIPSNIGDMNELESLDLSRNQLFGEIPRSISELTFLNNLNLSYNRLSGEIPLSTQIQSFSVSSFVGNDLCGPPVTESCNETSSSPGTTVEEREGKEVDWFVVAMVVGFVVGFGCVWLPLLFFRSWRFAYFRFLDYLWLKLSDIYVRCLIALK